VAREVVLELHDSRPVALDADAVAFVIPDENDPELTNVHFKGRETGVTVVGHFQEIRKVLFSTD
jgi:hypothetical protein